jgi:hypothetical protein
MLPNVYDLSPPEVAVICVMLLRGPQTVGELRERTGRLYEFSDIGEVNETLEGLIRRDEPLVTKLERQPGQKEARFAHLLSGEVTQESISVSRPSSTTANDRITDLESKVNAIQNELVSMREMFEEFRRQFE